MARQAPRRMSDRMVLVRWVDSAGTSGWRPRAEAVADLDRPSIMACLTVGYLIGEGADAIMVAASIGHDGDAVDNTLQIPRVAIVSIKTLR